MGDPAEHLGALTPFIQASPGWPEVHTRPEPGTPPAGHSTPDVLHPQYPARALRRVQASPRLTDPVPGAGFPDPGVPTAQKLSGALTAAGSWLCLSTADSVAWVEPSPSVSVDYTPEVRPGLGVSVVGEPQGRVWILLISAASHLVPLGVTSCLWARFLISEAGLGVLTTPSPGARPPSPGGHEMRPPEHSQCIGARVPAAPQP